MSLFYHLREKFGVSPIITMPLIVLSLFGLITAIYTLFSNDI